MLKFLKGVVGGSGTGPRDLPYNIGEPYPSAWDSWTHFCGSSKNKINSDDESYVDLRVFSASILSQLPSPMMKMDDGRWGRGGSDTTTRVQKKQLSSSSSSRGNRLGVSNQIPTATTTFCFDLVSL